jgi:hypothetical protein
MKGAPKTVEIDHGSSHLEDCNEFLARELGDDYTGDIVNDVCTLKRSIHSERRKKRGQCEALEDAIESLENEKADATRETRSNSSSFHCARLCQVKSAARYV